MTNASQKAATRARMASTGENYTTAKRAIQQARLKAQSEQLDSTLAEQRTRTLNERFDTVAEQLGSDKPPAVRLAGVHAMAGLADDWQDNRQTCIDVLCAYLRMPYEPDPAMMPCREAAGLPGQPRGPPHRHPGYHRPSERHRARLLAWPELRLYRCGFRWRRLRGAKFPRGVTYQRRVLRRGGQLHRRRVLRRDGQLHRRQVLRRDGRLHSARFSGGTVDFAGASSPAGRSTSQRRVLRRDSRLQQRQVLRREVSFAGAEFNAEFSGATPAGQSASPPPRSPAGRSVHRRRVLRRDGRLHQCQVLRRDGRLHRAKFSGGTVNFTGATFSGGTVHFTRAASGRSPRTLAQVSTCPIRRPVSCCRQPRALHRIAPYRERNW